jgi:DNA-binding PadR family transcriptional regulator
MHTMTDAELAILSIVAEGPIHGHDIQTTITRRGLRAWTNIGVSSMYYVLEKLEKQGLVESTGPRQVEGPARRQYRITSAGFGVLQTAVADLISTPREGVNGFELGLANLHVLRPDQIRTAFITYQQELGARLAQARDRWRCLNESRAPFNVDAMFGHHVAMLEAEVEWIRGFIEQWESQAPPDDSIPDYPEPASVPRMKQVILPHDPDSPHRVPTRPLVSSKDPSVPTEAETDMFSSHNETPADSKTPVSLEAAPYPAATSEHDAPLDEAGEDTHNSEMASPTNGANGLDDNR